MTDRVPIAELRRRILKDAAVVPAPKTKKLIPEADVHDLYPKTPQMKYIETKYHIRLELTIYKGSLTDVVQLFGGEVDRSTISRWRKHISKYVWRTE